MVYYVYLNWTGNNDQKSGRVVLIFASRQIADEFWNRCIETKSGTWLLTDITRHTPQFWSFNTADQNTPYFFADQHAKDLEPMYMAARISGYDNNYSTSPTIIPEDPTGHTEYRSGHSYYIRTKTAPHMYWFSDGASYCLLSSCKRSKFKIDRDTSADEDQSGDNERRVLVRKDSVRLTALSAKNYSAVGIDNGYVSMSSGNFWFHFGSFYNGDFGMDWPSKSGDTEAFISFKTSLAGDEWELVN